MMNAELREIELSSWWFWQVEISCKEMVCNECCEDIDHLEEQRHAAYIEPLRKVNETLESLAA